MAVAEAQRGRAGMDHRGKAMNKKTWKVLTHGASAGALLGAVAAALPAQAASIRDNPDAKRLGELEQEVRILRNRVKKLEANKAATPGRRTVTSGNDEIKVRLYGQVNRAVLVGLSKRDSQVHNVDNDNSQSRIGLIGSGRLGGGWSVGARIEVGLNENKSDQVSDLSPRVTGVDLRRVELWFTHKAYGRLWLGKGPTASDNISNADLSGTRVVTTSAIADMAGGINFHKDGMSTSIIIDDLYSNLDGNSRRNRVRYDTPVFFGFQFRVSYDESDVLSLGLFYDGKPFGLKTIRVSAAVGFVYAGGAGVTDPSNIGGPGDRNLVSGSISALHLPTGLSVTFQMATRTSHAPSADLWNWYIKAGWQGRPLDIGKTAVSIDFGRGDNFTAEGNRLWTVGVGLVQKIDRAATELYLAYRFHHAYTRGYGKLDSIHAIMTGARVKF